MARLRVPTAEHITKLPPLTDEEVRACETEFGVCFPAALIDLLKEQNGGYFENWDFKLNGRDYSIDDVTGISSSAKWGAIQPLGGVLDPEFFLPEELQRIREVIGDPARVLPFSGDGHYFYALDYNRLNKKGEPTVAYISIEGEPVHERVADSFAELLAGQYEGDAEAVVSLAEADRLTVIASGGYSGSRPQTPEGLRHSWKICGTEDRIIVLASENYGWGPTLERYEMQQSALDLTPVDAEHVAGELGPELANLVLPSLTAALIEEWDAAGVVPPCYSLRLPIDPTGDERVRHQTSAPYQGKWKNTSVEVVYAQVFSGSKAELERALGAVIECISRRR
jgi:hypothetical protein